MYLRKLSVVNFKNYSDTDLNFSERINCFVGPNGVGKTNLLDAIHYLSLCKSYFNAVDSQNIRHKNEFSVIQGEFDVQGDKESIYCGIQKNKRKQFSRNKKDYKKLSEHIGLIPLVMISPSDRSLIMEGGEERRKFINGVIAQYDRIYLNDIMNYNRVLTQRNKFLKNISDQSSPDMTILDVYNDQLIEYGENIFTVRKKFVQELIPVFEYFYKYISKENEEVRLEYRSQLMETNFRELLIKNLKKDRILQYTTSGIHRDDLSMKLGGYSLKKVGSQGQQKTFQLALKLAKFEFIRQVSGNIPILLLDDVFDKFDHQRVEQIIRLVSENNFGQIFITDTDESRMREILDQMGIENRVFSLNKENEIIHSNEA